MKHPELSELALHAGSDLRFWRGLAVSAHLRACSRCRAEVDAFCDAAANLRDDAESMPIHVDWDHLAAEMKANIRLGLEAGEIVGGPPAVAPARRPAWVPAGAMAMVASLFLALGWWQARSLRPPVAANPAPSVARGEVIFKAGAGSIGVMRDGEMLALTNDGARAAAITVGTQGSLNARYIDDDSGQVTIHHVFTE